MSATEDAFARASGEGIHRLAIPTPFAAGRVNCYLVEDEPLTLVATGPHSGKSLDELEQAVHRAGHSPSDTVFWDAERLILIAGDHLLGHISSTPLVSRPLEDSGRGAAGERPRALVTYIESMLATRELPARIVLPGHGEP